MLTELQLHSLPICSLSPSRICKLTKVSLVVWTNSFSNSRLMLYKCNSNNTNRTLTRTLTLSPHFTPSTPVIQKLNRSHTLKDRDNYHSHQTIIWWTLKKQRVWETLLRLWPYIKTIPANQRACQTARAMHFIYQSRNWLRPTQYSKHLVPVSTIKGKSILSRNDWRKIL